MEYVPNSKPFSDMEGWLITVERSVQLNILKVLTKEPGNEPDEELLDVLLEQAKDIILRNRFPHGNYPTRVVKIPKLEDENLQSENTEEDAGEEYDTVEETYIEPQYEMLQVRIAQALYNKLGAEGQTSHSENGISRNYGTDGIPLSLLREIVPVATVIS